MSYRISFKIRVAETDEYISVGNCDANITWNVRKIIELSTGLPWKNEENNGYCVDVIPSIRRGREELIRNPEKYKPYEPDNGWGSIESTVHFFTRILEAWDTYAEWTRPAIVAKTTFWVS